MSDRRSFLKAAAYLGPGGLVASKFPATVASPARREIFIGGQRVKVLDLQAHCGIQGGRTCCQR